MGNIGIVALAEAKKGVGGKANSLAILLRAGFNVPPGFVIRPEAKLDEAYAWFDKLGAQKVAIRSSAEAEDGQKDAWAGQFDTFLNVERKNLLEKIKACRRSAKSERAKAYAKGKGLKSGGVSVVVQAMVPADISGVGFSVHPVTQNKTQMVLEAVSGLAEKLVSGTVTPDTYVINKNSLEVSEQYLSSVNPLLDKQQIKEVATELIKIERLYRLPIDIEWSIAGNDLYILQARPITTLD